jgi:DNA-binding NarL/FixJ family response regulator
MQMAKSLGHQPRKAAKKLFIVEDHPVFREGMVQMLGTESDLVVCGEAGNAEKAFPEIVRLKPDLVLVDITLPGKSGLELIREIRAVNRVVKLLVVSMHDEAIYADRVLRAGADGYIMKQEDFQEIIRAIRDVLAGRIYVSEEVLSNNGEATQSPRTPTEGRSLAQLTDSELEVLELLGRGRSNPEIARQLRLTAKAVEARGHQIRRKLKFKTANQLIRYAVCWVEDVVE